LPAGTIIANPAPAIMASALSPSTQLTSQSLHVDAGHVRANVIYFVPII
jgi:hypothetical protein